ncbi:MAG TPA: glycosyltransferase family 39 protein [Dehalococcoidia bacterium]|nr:glycosyltransferase family 39 protein [Dehalococcoidia bacterium]
MATSIPVPGIGSDAQRLREWSSETLRKSWVAYVPLGLVSALAFLINSWGLSDAGDGNTYYAAAVRSMSESWHNFFYGAFDPGGFITVDKPPFFLWVDAISVRIFGYSSLSLLLPSAIAGALGVALLWLIVRRYFGVLAATIAAIVLALTPITVAVGRMNLPEPFYILALIGAAGAVLMSLQSKRWWAWTIAAGLLVGIAFNTKMLAAWIPGPALALAIVVGVAGSWRTSWKRWLPQLVILGGVTLLASASWMLIVDAIPASQRPYIGGSNDNSVQDLVLGYNGFGRVEGEGGPGGGGGPANNRGGGFAPNNQGGVVPNQGGRGGFGGNGTRPGGPQGNVVPGGPQGTIPNRGTAPNRGFNGFGPGGTQGTTPNQGFNALPPGGFNFGGTRGGGNGGATGPGGIIAGQPSLWRMFDPANGGQIGWLLPFALVGGVFSLWRWYDNRVLRAAVIAFLGWVLLFGGIFSYSQGIYHSYYTSALAPGIAALVGISVVAFSDLIKRHFFWVAGAVLAAGVTIWAQLTISHRFTNFFDWVPAWTIVVVVFGVGVLAVAAWQKRLPVTLGMAIIVAGLLLIPAEWSQYETAHAALNTTLPQAGPREGAAGRSFGSNAFDTGTAGLAAWLEMQDQQGSTWHLTVSSAQNASTLIADYDVPVLALGGFSGGDPTITAQQFGQMVSAGEVRFVDTGGGLGGFGGRIFGGGFGGLGLNHDARGSSAVMAAVESVCKQVTDTSLPAQFRGTIYDCAGMGAQLQAW